MIPALATEIMTAVKRDLLEGCFLGRFPKYTCPQNEIHASAPTLASIMKELSIACMVHFRGCRTRGFQRKKSAVANTPAAITRALTNKRALAFA